MDTKDARRKNLQTLVRQYKTQAALANAIGVKPPQISRWLSTTTADPRGMEEESARKIEELLGLPNNWMDSSDEEPTARKETLSIASAHGLIEQSPAKYAEPQSELVIAATRLDRSQTVSPEVKIAITKMLRSILNP